MSYNYYKSKLLFTFGVILSLVPYSGYAQNYKFDFGSGAVAPGYIKITPQTKYSSTLGYGIDKGNVSSVERVGNDALRSDYLTTTDELFFSVAVPQGNYDVTIIFGDASGPTATTVKAENRRLLFDRVSTNTGSFVSKTITVNRREVKSINGTVTMSIKDREKGYFTWDGILTLRFTGKKPAICALEIVKNDNAKTLFLCGNSTVVDQLSAPWCSWGQMIPYFFTPGVVVANYAESGLTAGSFLSMKRLDKIMADAKSGDYVFVEFGHNDQKSSTDTKNYANNLKTYRDKIKAKGAIPVFVTPTARQSENDPRTSIGGLAQEMRETAASLGVTYIDLNQMVTDLHKALGSNTKYLYMHTAGDQTHFCEYGGYELARCVMKGLEEKFPSLKNYFIPEYTTFDPSKPDPLYYLTKDKQSADVNTYTISATAAPGGSISRSPQGIDLAQGLKVIFTAVPSGGWKFTGWSGDYNGTDVVYTIDSLNSDVTLNASFMPVDEDLYEAEYAVMVNSIAESVNTGYSGTGYANLNNETGSYIEVPVYVNEDGQKNLTITYANAGEADRSISVEVNGTEVIPSLGFSSTGSWEMWGKQVITLDLNEGINGIKLVSVTADGGPNIDKLEIGSVASVIAGKSPFPSPTIKFNSGKLEILSSGTRAIFRVEIISMSGRKILSETVKTTAGSRKTILPVNNLLNGSYLIKITADNYARMKRCLYIR